ncbi:ABC transporter E family member 2-like [Salvia hispanica]|uniref:ABC transporter E family member 2-like n=1 Tax=Salvia hispanica TaxID=49212 RepID=UPI002009D377|nr:ABC transporter E family member 2-like [Salvia hispanica]
MSDRIASDEDTIHCFGPNSFKLHSLPAPRAGHVLGLVGNNGTGKSISLRLLSGKFKFNLGRLHNPPDLQEILDHFKGSELHDYFNRIYEDKLNVICKPQYVEYLPERVQGNVGQLLSLADKVKDMKQELAADLDLIQVMDRNVEDLSRGELQRFSIAITALQNADIFLFDEPSSYLDVKQRLKAAQVVRSLVRPNNYVIVAEHDLSVLDYLSDFICCLYGEPGVYGVVTLPFSAREGINIFLARFVPTENLGFRYEPFMVAETPQESHVEIETCARYKYPTMTITRGGKFGLKVVQGEFTDSEIIVMLGENGTGKTTFLHMLVHLLYSWHFKPDSVEGSDVEIPEYNVSYKQERIGIKLEFECTVGMLLCARIPDAIRNPRFVSDVFEPLSIQKFMDKNVRDISAGELQKLSLTLCLGKPADIYLIDEPSTYLDSESWIVAANVIKNFIRNTKKTALVVEHDITMATYLADRVIVYEGKPSIDCVASPPQPLLTGMNLFLSHLDITVRRDPANMLPRFNKLESKEDREQKASRAYYYMDD